MSQSRRQFIKYSLATGAAITIGGCTSSSTSSPKIIGANERLRIAIVGLHGRGEAHINGFFNQSNVEIAYLVDPDEKVLAKRMQELKKRTKGTFTTKGLSDIRHALDDKSVHAVSIAAPNHWHSLMTIWAAQAGKHVYVEKPMSHDVNEGRICEIAQKKYGIVIQHGTQRRSDPTQAGLSQMIRSGHFGKLKISYGYCCKPRNSIGTKPSKSSPSNLDWNLWRGPAMIDKYHDNFVHYNWHWFWASGNGDMNNQGTHQLDVAYWAIDEKMKHPVKSMALGSRFVWNDQGETPNTMFAMSEYANGQSVYFNVRNVNHKGYKRQVENEYYFEDGGKIVRGIYYSKGSTKGEKISIKKAHVTPGGNWGSFIAAVKAADPSMANGNVTDAHRGCVLGHLMNNSYRLGKTIPASETVKHLGNNDSAIEHFAKLNEIMTKGVGIKEKDLNYTVGPMLTFNPKTETHIGEHAKEANALLKNKNRKGFEVPEANRV